MKARICGGYEKMEGSELDWEMMEAMDDLKVIEAKKMVEKEDGGNVGSN